VTDTEDNTVDGRDNLTRLLNLGRRKRPRISRRYTVFVNSMRFVLPVIALAIITVVLAWPKMDDNFTAIEKKDIIPQTTGRNELMSPHFESVTQDQNPYIITAARAVQDMDDQSIVLLEQPVADITMSNGKLNMKANNGVYRQNEKILILDGQVQMVNQDGFTLQSQRMNISVDNKIAWTDTIVHGEGTAGTLDAQAMNANNETGIVVFTGPAKLTLNQTTKGSLP
jgi:lipopolysaccharide export system protein LptC